MGTLHRCIEERRYSQFAFLATHHSEAVNSRDECGRTPLHRCCTLRSSSGSSDGGWAVSCARTLLQLGAEPCAADLEARTPLHYACRNGNLSMTRTLLQLIPDICVDSSDSDANTPLHYAAACGDPRLLGLLLARYSRFDLDVDRQNQVGFTPLQLAAANGHLDVARSLVAAGASTTSRDSVFFKSAHEWLAAHFHESEASSLSAKIEPRDDEFGSQRQRSIDETRAIVARWRIDRQADVDFSRLPLEDAWIRGVSSGEPLFLAFSSSSSSFSSSSSTSFSSSSSQSPRRSRRTAARSIGDGVAPELAMRATSVVARGHAALRRRRSFDAPSAVAALSSRDGGGPAAIEARDASLMQSLACGEASGTDASTTRKMSEENAADSRMSDDKGGRSGGLPLSTSWIMLRSVTEVLLEQLSDSYRPPPPPPPTAQLSMNSIEQIQLEDGAAAIAATQAASRRA